MCTTAHKLFFFFFTSINKRLSYDSGEEAGPAIATSVSGCPGGRYTSVESWTTLFGSLERPVSADPDFYATSVCECKQARALYLQVSFVDKSRL